MRKFFIGKEIVKCNKNDEMELKYYILAEEKEESNIKFTKYGIEIEKDNMLDVEKSKIEDITTNEEEIKKIIKLLMKNNVTPVHLHDVIVDML